MTLVASSEDTGGQYALTDSTVPQGGEAPPHIHHHEDEAVWMLEEDLEIPAGERGSFVHLPRGIAHTYENVGVKPARFLTPIDAGLEKVFEEVRKPATDPTPPSPFGEEDVERLLTVAPKCCVGILPSPEA